MGLETTGGPERRKRPPSRLALQLTDAFAPCAEWQEVKVIREGNRRRSVLVPLPGQASAGGPFDWAQAA